MKEPMWKLALNWGAVGVFLLFPPIIFSIQLYVWTHPGWMLPPPEEKLHIAYLQEFLRNITILVFGLAGLRTWETIKKNGKEEGKKAE